MPAELWQELNAHRERSAYTGSEDFVFATATGRPVDGSNVLRWWKNAAVAAILGHVQASTSERYVRLARSVSAERAQRLADQVLSA